MTFATLFKNNSYTITAIDIVIKTKRADFSKKL